MAEGTNRQLAYRSKENGAATGGCRGAWGTAGPHLQLRYAIGATPSDKLDSISETIPATTNLQGYQPDEARHSSECIMKQQERKELATQWTCPVSPYGN
jgi:hypothetical protein